MDALYVIADDLTGACDVGAALLPWPAGIAVHPDGTAAHVAGDETGTLMVRNTQSRTLSAVEAAGRVRSALAPLGGSFRGIVLKKIDTGLRGQLGAELDAAMDALGAAEAFVLPAIPEVGRTTLRGVQLIDGVPVHRTAFGRDPENPVSDANVTRVIAATARRRSETVALEAVRQPGGVARAIEAARARGACILVVDAETDGDLETVVEVLLARPRPLLLAGSIGLARALRRVLSGASDGVGGPAAGRTGGTGVLVVSGSAHPVARAQREYAVRREALSVLEVNPGPGAEATGREAGRLLANEMKVALVSPERRLCGSERAIAEALRVAACAALAVTRARGLVLIGGETAFHVLGGLGHPCISIEQRLGPLIVQGRLLHGVHRDIRVVTKGGSSGREDLLADVVAVLAGGGV